MKDFVPLGTGNSRFLKTVNNAKSLYPTYEAFLDALIAGALPIDLNGINAAGVSQMGTALNKNNLLKDTTAEALGLTADPTVDDALVSLIGISKLGDIKNLVIEKIQTSRTWTAPKAAVQRFIVFAVGGGGGGGYNEGYAAYCGGGGSGYVERGEFVIPENTAVHIVCGAGGARAAVLGSAGETGGSTSFGDYLTAQGGTGGRSGADKTNAAGGNGNAGGGGGQYGNGGNGGTYGGGGGGGQNGYGGNGGTYGGGGGGNPGGGTGGTYGGNGGKYGERGEDGTVGPASIAIDLLMFAEFMNDATGGELYSTNPSSPGCGGGGGGYCSKGGKAGGLAGGGGGGFFGRGGDASTGAGGGGGGGYCGNGGGPYILQNGSVISTEHGGGGGGFFCNGGNAYTYNGGGGGGFFDDGDSTSLGGGGNGGVAILYFKEEA